MSNIPVLGQFPQNQVPVVGSGNVPVLGQQPMAGQVPVLGQQPMVGQVPVMGQQPMIGQIPVLGQQVGQMSEFSLFGVAPGLQNMGSAAPNLTSPQQATQIRIRKMVLIETKPQQTQHGRVFIPRVDQNTLRIMGNYRDAAPAMGISATGSPVTSMPMDGNVIADMQAQGANFFNLAPQPTGAAQIANGWDTVRFKFMITVDVFMAGKHLKTEYVNGYTDYTGVVWTSESLNPDMVFYVDSVSSSLPYVNANTNGIGHSMQDSSVVLTKPNVIGFGNPQQVVTTRPADVFAELAVGNQRAGAEMAQAMIGAPAAPIPYMNMNTTMNATPRLSNVFNNNPVNFAARVLDAHSKTFAKAADTTDIYRSARALVKENTFSSSHFLHMLDERLGSIEGVVGNTFTLKHLYRVDNQLQSPLDDRIVVFKPDAQMRELMRTGNGEVVSIPAGTEADSLSGTGEDVANAMAILHSACAHFRKAGASYVSCVLTNHGGFPEAVISSLAGIDDGTLAIKVRSACDDIMSEAVRAITRDDSSYYIQINIDTYNEAFIKLQFGMNHPREFVAPCYALGVTAPVVTTNQSVLDNIVAGVRDIADNIYGVSLTIGDPGNFNTNSSLW